MIKFADKSMLPLLKVIWQEAFEDDEIYTDFFYKNRFTEDNTLVWTEEDKPVSILTLLPAEMIINSETCPVKYVYGVATKLEYRGKGISTALINYANSQADINNEILILVPSNERLFDFYKKCGYNTSFFLKELTITEHQFNQFPKLNYIASDISAEEYKAVRDNYFMKDGYIMWDINAIDYIIRENVFSGGTSVKITYGNVSYILMYHKNNNVLYVTETSLNKEIIFSILSDIAAKEKCNAIFVRLPKSYDMALYKKPFGMIYSKMPVLPYSAYLNLILD